VPQLPTVAIIPSLNANGKEPVDGKRSQLHMWAFYLIYAELIDKKQDLWYSTSGKFKTTGGLRAVHLGEALSSRGVSDQALLRKQQRVVHF
jgi:hypothetical protein